MDYEIHNSTARTEIRLSGRLTFADHPTFRSVIAAFDAPAGHRLVFDLSGLEFVDSSGLGMFIIARDVARKRQLDFALRGARDEVKRLLELAKFHRMVAIAD